MIIREIIQITKEKNSKKTTKRMKNKYVDLIDQTFEFPQEEFHMEGENLFFHGIDLNKLIEKYGTPFKFSYLPVISNKITQCRGWFQKAFEENNYKGQYQYSYCTKSSHFDFVIKECLKSNVNIETSSAFDLDIIISLFHQGLISPDTYVLCNGFKTRQYVEKISNLIDLGFTKVIPIVDNVEEVNYLDEIIQTKIQIGIRIASEEDPKFEFYTSRLGIRYKDIVPFYNKALKGHTKFEVSFLHFFVNTGIRDNAYYWNELRKFINVYTGMIKAGAPIKHLDIGGGFPVKNSLGFQFDYEYLVNEIVVQIKQGAEDVNANHPNIFTEFGSFTVAESGGVVFSVLNQKKQNEKELWNMVDSSFMTTLPDTWAVNTRYIMLPINKWNDKYERVFLGGMTCDSDDYYNSEQHVNAIYLPEYDPKTPLYIGFFNTGAYQESISGYGGIKHCLIPAPKHLLIYRDENGDIVDEIYRKEQTGEEMLKILGY